MEVKIGITNTPREITFESSADPTEIVSVVSKALAGSEPLLQLKDERGRTYLIPTAAVAYFEIGTEETRRIGFVS